LLSESVMLILSDEQLSAEFSARTCFRSYLVTRTHGSFLQRQGAVCGRVSLLKCGIVKLLYSQMPGAEAVIGLRSNGCIIGPAFGGVSPSSAVCVSECKIWQIPLEQWRSVISNDFELLQSVHRYLLKEWAAAATLMALMNSRTATARVLAFLSELAETEVAGHKTSREGRWPVAEWEVAQLLGITPSHFSRILGKLKRMGVIVRQREGIGIVKLDVLAALADDPANELAS